MSDYFSTATEAFRRLTKNPPPELDTLVETILDSWDRGGKVVSFGNGGSASDSLHFTTELVAKFDRDPIHRPAISLCSNTATLTATSNDWSYDEVFSRQVQANASQEDVILGISTSGNSSNVLEGLDAAQKKGCICFGLTGKDGGRMSGKEYEIISVPARKTPHVQELHITCLHYVCRELDRGVNN